MNLIGLSGLSGSGKSTVGDILLEHGYDNMAFAEPLKRALAVMFDENYEQWELPESKSQEVPGIGISRRYLMQTLGTEWAQGILKIPLWIKLAERRYVEGTRTVFTDVRFDAEADWIREKGGRIWHISKRDVVRQLSGHASEDGVTYRWPTDRMLYNDCTLEVLYERVKALLRQ